MSLYQFLPLSPTQNQYEPFVTWNDALNDGEIQSIITYSEKNLDFGNAIVSSNAVLDKKIRRSTVGWIELNSDTQWIYDRIAYISRNVNSNFYRYDLYGCVEHIQYTIYNESDSGHYDWHADDGVSDVARKLSVVIQLSDPLDYEGGELQLLNGSETMNVVKRKGMMTLFPSFKLHRVTPVTKGIRKTLVVWLAGPPFR